MFPTRVGMNRNHFNYFANGVHVPHTCGDEPSTDADLFPNGICSPHVWG